MLDLRSLLGDLPSVAQYVIVLALVMALLYVALWLTRKIGSRFNSEKITFDDPEKYADSVPDLFATTEFRHKKPQKGAQEKASEATGTANAPEGDSRDRDLDQDLDSDED